MKTVLRFLKFILLLPVNILFITCKGFSFLCEVVTKGFFFYFKLFFSFLLKVFPNSNFFQHLKCFFTHMQNQPFIFMLFLLYAIAGFSLYNISYTPQDIKESNGSYVEEILNEDKINKSDSENILSSNTDSSGSNSYNKEEKFIDTNLFRNYAKTALTDVNFTELLEKNSDTVAWINVDGTYINYPVVQAGDNDYYLTHSFHKEEKNSGWVFVDYRNSSDMSNQNTIFYGHNLLNDTAFGSLDFLFEGNWVSTSNHKIVILTSNRQYVYEVFSIYYTDPNTYYLQTDFGNEEDYLEFLYSVKEKSIFPFDVTLTSQDRIITLSTCTVDNKNRKVVHAKLVFENRL